MHHQQQSDFINFISYLFVTFSLEATGALPPAKRRIRSTIAAKEATGMQSTLVKRPYSFVYATICVFISFISYLFVIAAAKASSSTETVASPSLGLGYPIPVSPRFKIQNMEVVFGGDSFVQCIQDQLEVRCKRDCNVKALRAMIADPLRDFFREPSYSREEKLSELNQSLLWTDPNSNETRRTLPVSYSSSSTSCEEMKNMFIDKYCKWVTKSKYHACFQDVSQKVLAKALNVKIAIYDEDNLTNPVTTINDDDRHGELLHIMLFRPQRSASADFELFASLHDSDCSCKKCKKVVVPSQS